MRFCDVCANILRPVYVDGYRFECCKCKKVFDPLPADTLVHEERLLDDSVATVREYASLDACNPIELRACPSCARPFMRYTVAPHVMKKIYHCICAEIAPGAADVDGRAGAAEDDGLVVAVEHS